MYRKNLFIFFIFLLGFILNVISVQIVSSSFKELQGALGASIEQVSYVMSASLIAEVIIIPFSGWLAKLLSTRVLFLISISGFVSASLGCALSTNYFSMVLFRGFQGFFGGVLDLFFQRFIEIWGGLPQLYILIILSSVIIPGFWTLLLILLLFGWTSLVGVVRAEFLRARNFEFVRAARALGVGDMTIMFRHVLPNAMVATLTFLPLILTGSITSLTALDFLGLGLPPGSPSLGELLQQGKTNLQAPWLGLTSTIAISLTLVLLIFVGEAVRDAFDPKKTFSD